MSHRCSPARRQLTLSRLRVEIHGAVQGVGFRPFVYRLATELGLPGWVINDARGVFIEVEGPRERVEQFLTRLPAEVPPRAIVQSLDSRLAVPRGYERFEIRHSDEAGAKTVLILPDIATCPDCLAGDLRPRRPAPPLPVHQLHQLRPALHDHRGAALRPAEHDHAPFRHVPRVPARVRRPARPALPRAAERVPRRAGRRLSISGPGAEAGEHRRERDPLGAAR